MKIRTFFIRYQLEVFKIHKLITVTVFLTDAIGYWLYLNRKIIYIPYLMIFYMFFQILISWLLACGILKLFNKAISIPQTNIYQEPKLLTDLLAIIEIEMSLKGKLMAGRILHNTIGLCFTAIYYLIWYNQFAEISLLISFSIGIIISLLGIISWIFIHEIVPADRMTNFRGYYLQLVFVYNVFTLIAVAIYQIFL